MEGHRENVTMKPPLISPLHEVIFVTKDRGSSSRKRSKPFHFEEGGEEGKTPTMKREKERKERINENYNELLSMLPKPFPKASREKIVTETIEHIKALKKELKRLEEQKNSSTSMVGKGKMSMFSNSNSSINVSVSGSGDMVFFGIHSFARQRLVTDIFMIFQKQGTEILAANIAVNNGQLTLTVTALVNGNKDNIIENIKSDILVL